MPSLSAVIPNYNHAKYLPFSIESIMKQSYKPIELIIVDDASTDNSLDVVSHYQKMHPEIFLCKNTENMGANFSFVQGAKLARGDYVVLCAADDMPKPMFFEKSMAVIKKCPNLGLTCADVDYFDDKRSFIFRGIKSDKTLILAPNESFELMRKKGFAIHSQASVFKTDLVIKFGMDDNLISLADSFLNLQIANEAPIAYIPLTLGAFRMVKTSFSHRHKKQLFKRNKAYLYMMKKIAKDKQFYKTLKKSGGLAIAGLFMIVFLIIHPKYWSFFPSTTAVILKRKFRYFYQMLKGRFLKFRLKKNKISLQ